MQLIMTWLVQASNVLQTILVHMEIYSTWQPKWASASVHTFEWTELGMKLKMAEEMDHKCNGGCSVAYV